MTEGSPKTILCAIDLSPFSDLALRDAAERAVEAGAKLVVFHCLPTLFPVTPIFPQLQQILGLEIPRKQFERADRVVRDRIAAIVRRRPDALEVIVEEGDPYRAIVAKAAEVRADLIVLAARGSSPPTRAVIGSVARRVARAAPCPVLVVRENETGSASGPILAASDFSDPSYPAISAAAVEAERTGAKLQVLHVVPFTTDPMISGASSLVSRPEDMETIESELRSEAEAHCREAVEALGIREAIPLIDVGVPAVRIIENVRKERARLLVMGTEGRSGLSRLLLGSVAETVLELAPSPVLLVRLRPKSES